MRGAAEHYYCFLPTLREQLIPNTMANPCYYKLIQYVQSRAMLSLVTICKTYVNKLGVLQFFSEQGNKQVF